MLLIDLDATRLVPRQLLSISRLSAHAALTSHRACSPTGMQGISGYRTTWRRGQRMLVPVMQKVSIRAPVKGATFCRPILPHGRCDRENG